MWIKFSSIPFSKSWSDEKLEKNLHNLFYGFSKFKLVTLSSFHRLLGNHLELIMDCFNDGENHSLCVVALLSLLKYLQTSTRLNLIKIYIIVEITRRIIKKKFYNFKSSYNFHDESSLHVWDEFQMGNYESSSQAMNKIHKNGELECLDWVRITLHVQIFIFSQYLNFLDVLWCFRRFVIDIVVVYFAVKICQMPCKFQRTSDLCASLLFWVELGSLANSFFIENLLFVEISTYFAPLRCLWSTATFYKPQENTKNHYFFVGLWR